MNNWQCTYCGIVVQKDGRPNVTGCTKSSSHTWKDLGKVGSTPYQCKYCGIMVYSEARPNVDGKCSSSSHTWNKL